VLFVGAGQANLGIGRLLAAAMEREGLAADAARRRCWFVDSQGLVVASRADLADHKRPFAHDHPPIRELLAAVEAIRPTVLIGATGRGGLFTEAVLAALARMNQRPVIFALSNPTSKAECTAEQVYRATNGRAVFATGSPFAPVTLDGRAYVTAQANNSFIFPGLGLGALASGATRVSDEMFFAAARALAGEVTEADLAAGRIFPSTARLREVAAAVAVEVAGVAWDEGLAHEPRPRDLAAHVRARMYAAL
jgi:malate dehydrogenase (oxaloacetate-decarboxylating)(NADP+)